MSAVKISVSLPADVLESAKARAKRMGYRKFSNYVSKLVENDLLERPAHAFKLTEEASEHQAEPPPSRIKRKRSDHNDPPARPQ